MANDWKFRSRMPTTSIAQIQIPPGPLRRISKRKHATRVSTSDGCKESSIINELRKKYEIDLEHPPRYPPQFTLPQPPIPRPESDKLNSKIRSEMERRQFAPMSPNWVWRVLTEMYKVDEKKWGKWAVDLDGMKLAKGDWRYLLKVHYRTWSENGAMEEYELGHVTNTIADLYIYMACDYRNRAIARTLKSGDLAGDTPTKQKVSSIIIDSNKLYWDKNKGGIVKEGEDENGEDIRRIVVQDFPKAWEKTMEALAQYDDETFANLDYIVIPHEYNAFHTQCLGIAPKQRFVFHIDNSGLSQARFESSLDDKYGAYYHSFFQMSLLEAIIYTRFDKGEIDTAEWPLYGQWSYRTDHRDPDNRTTDNSPNATRQNDTYNCALNTMTSAVNLIFGYDMACYVSGMDLSPIPGLTGKRIRVAAEFLNGGFNYPFNYPLFKIPTELQEIIIDETYKQNLRPPPTLPLRNDGVGNIMDEWDDEDTEDRVDPETEEEEEKAPQEEARTKVKKSTRYKKVKWHGQPALDWDPGKPHPAGPGSTGDDLPIRTLWPAQMDPTRTGKCGIVYPITKPRFSDSMYNDKFECKRAAIFHRMEGWELWEEMPLYMFKRWMENVMAGRTHEELSPWVKVLKLDGRVFSETKY
ncbi:uncharacterized protein Bfra_004777 [Botrytis fragariae]|uniref:Uncharacterized protein n=1 Tax=Botrytis fragariae TaxID=1964551 RepID=A0A8H6AWE3_9HELO|nr:uncharacterized protein Bfra_004777 [Botrytis fragariae]KAF5874759.1 hypothetical protein Bfra_004777 [Botrytis fragariae]